MNGEIEIQNDCEMQIEAMSSHVEANGGLAEGIFSKNACKVHCGVDIAAMSAVAVGKLAWRDGLGVEEGHDASY